MSGRLGGGFSGVGSGGSLPSLRQRNRSLVIVAVRDGGAASRVDIARLTGLSKTTVSSLVTELLSQSVLIEPGEPDKSTPGSGRPATPLAMHPNSGTVVGVHFAHDGVTVALAELNGHIVDRVRHPGDVDHQLASSLDFAASATARLIEQHRPDKLLGLGAAVSTPVTARSHLVSSPAMLHDWTEVNVADRLNSTTGLPVHVANDANAGALAEAKFGAGRGVDDLIYVMLSEGVGAGLVLAGQLYEGSSGSAGELGHVVVARGGYVCRCGNRGCLETVAGSRGVIDAMAHNHGSDIDLDAILELSVAGHPGARRLFNDAGQAVGEALAGICTVLDPEIVVIGGRLAASGEPLLAGVRSVLVRNPPPVTNHMIEVVQGSLGQDAELLGAVLIAGQAAALGDARTQPYQEPGRPSTEVGHSAGLGVIGS